MAVLPMNVEEKGTNVMKILISDPVEQVCTDILTAEGFTVDNKPGIKPDELKSVIGEYDALVVRSGTQVTADIIAAGTRLKAIGRAGAGVDNINVEAATRRGVIVMNTPGGNTISTAEHTMSLLLSLARNIPQANESLKAGKWDRKKYTGTELFGKTVGVVGLGKVGREVALRCRAFGMHVIGYDPILAAEVAARENIELVSLDVIYQRSDIITVHTPLNDETRHLLGEATLPKCKPGVRIINCARGGIVDEAAVLKFLEHGHVSGYAVDVFVKEPPGDLPLLKHPHVVATPHLGASTEEAQEKVAKQIGQQLADVLKERGIAGAVNGEAVRYAFRSDLRPYIALGERLGRLQAQLMTGQLKRLLLGLSGTVPTEAAEAVAASVLTGVLSHRTEQVNLVNAPLLAKEMGVSLEVGKDGGSSAYTNQVTLTVETDKERRTFAGTVFGNGLVRLVEFDGFKLEVNPEGHLLLYRNVDRPGMLAKVGAELASAGINIGGLALGRDKPGQTALTVISVDTPIPADILGRVGRIEGVFEVRTVSL